MSNAYSEFAFVYDELMTDVPYDTYVELLDMAASGISGKRVLDIGCGTGLLSAKLAKQGADVTGIDLSTAMLEVAEQRVKALSLPVKFNQQAMQQLEGFKEFDVAVIAIDSLNYLSERQDVVATFHRIYSALAIGGVLVFDVHSTFKTDVIFQEGPFTFDNDRIAYIWETEEGEEQHSVYSELAFFVKNDSGTYRRFDEVHTQRTFPVSDYVDMLMEAGFSIERIFADWEDEAPHEESERIFFQARK
ncbi:class I SAM-dependent DNA methyltransferase [Sporosarcina limicola]|uniref:Cyclopropane fatty-acyl-phospholipid synthase-like methyltransferase n=1 Tax=Sporosarcina limicola TaxID=34101 RepID=A0A927R4A0_9BACL|nr:class I SAM-dependent methyltransferase [Sporosarcina limicola]MBE1554643.1 cyclopropane fatty-acyl-phospholipid synthase-like methyltransferase [Sporosarcina limicola]